MLFGGKLVAQTKGKTENAMVQDPVEAQRIALASLSKQEKLLLLELQRTRANIVQELGRLDPVLAANNWTDVQDTIEDYKVKIVSDLAANNQSRKRQQRAGRGQVGTGKQQRIMSSTMQPHHSIHSMSSSSSSSLPTFDRSEISKTLSFLENSTSAEGVRKLKTGVDMLPVLASNGESALEVGLRRQAPLQLPVFKLPDLDPARVAAALEERRVLHGKKGSEYQHKGKGDVWGNSAMNDLEEDLEEQQAVRAVAAAVKKNVTIILSPAVELAPNVYTEYLPYCRSLCNMASIMSPNEKAFVLFYLKLTSRDLVDIEGEIARLVAVAEASGEVLQEKVGKKKKKVFVF